MDRSWKAGHKGSGGQGKKMPRASPKALTKEDKGKKCSGFWSQKTDLGGFWAWYVKSKEKKKIHPFTYSALNWHNFQICEVLIYEIL